jgi:hypothetical protein
MSMQEVWCQQCGRKIEINSGLVEDGLLRGDYVKAQKMVKFTNRQGDILDQFHDGVFDICKACQRRGAVQSGDPSVLQSQRIMQRIKVLHETRPDLTADERRAEAIREEFDPAREPNKAFRAFLMERATRDPENDAAAHRALESIT